MSEQYEIIPVKEHIWAIQDGAVRMYLLNGKTASILIDTGYGSGDLLETLKPYAAGEIRVVNTHCHSDHTSGNSQFRHFYMYDGDLKEIGQTCPEDAVIETVADQSVIEAGDIRLEVVAIPGHTPGSIALLDREARILFSADSFAKNFPIYMQFPGQNMEAYRDSIRKMMSFSDLFDQICPCHGELMIEKAYMQKTLDCVEEILKLGQIEAHTPEYKMNYNDVTILY